MRKNLDLGVWWKLRIVDSDVFFLSFLPQGCESNSSDSGNEPSTNPTTTMYPVTALFYSHCVFTTALSHCEGETCAVSRVT